MAGILTGNVLGYSAPYRPESRIDLGPELEWTAEGRELRQMADRAFSDYVQFSRRPIQPFRATVLGQYPSALPSYQRYAENLRLLQSRSPAVAALLERETALVGRMADLRQQRDLLLQAHGRGLGSMFVALPPGPGSGYLDYARAGALSFENWTRRPVL